MKKKLIIAGISVILVLSLVLAFAACNDTLSDGIFSEGVIAVQNEDGLWGYADSNGDMVIDYQYYYALPFSNGVALVSYTSQGVTFLIDAEGNHLAGPYEEAGISEDGKWTVVTENVTLGSDYVGLYDNVNKTMKYDCVYDDIDVLENGYITLEYAGYLSVVDPATGNTVVDSIDFGNGNDSVVAEKIEGKWLITKTTTPAAEEGGADVVTYNVIDMTTGEQLSAAWDTIDTQSDWTILQQSAAETDSAKQWAVMEDTILEIPNGESVQTKHDDSMLVTYSTVSYEGADATGYTIYGKGGEVLHTGVQNVDTINWSVDHYYVCAYNAESGLTFMVFAGGVKYQPAITIPAGATSVYPTTISVYEGAISFTLNVLTEETTEAGGTITQVKNMVMVGENTAEIPAEYTLVRVENGKLVLQAANGRVGVFNTDMTAVTECIYTGAEVSESGYIIVQMGTAYGVLAADGATVLDCVYRSICIA